MKVTETAVRQDIRTLILLAGGTGSGKTESAMRLATGLAGGRKFAVIDTENGRALHKADDYAFAYVALVEPFTPERYTEAVEAVAAYPVIIIDSGSHEYDGPGGVLDIQADEFERMGGKESARMASWIAPKRRHKKFVQSLLRSPAHVILCLRAEDKIEVVKVDGKTVVRPKETLTGAQGWVPIVEKRLPFEATISLLLLQDSPGVPVPIKLEERHRALVPLDRPLDESVGEALAKWAAGSAVNGAHPAAAGAPSSPREPDEGSAPKGVPAPPELDQLVTSLLATGAIKIEHLWSALANERGVDVDTMIDRLGGRDAAGDLQWTPLGEDLQGDEAANLYARLSRYEANVGAAA